MITIENASGAKTYEGDVADLVVEEVVAGGGEVVRRGSRGICIPASTSKQVISQSVSQPISQSVGQPVGQR